MIVVIPCGAKKQKKACKAGEMYIGSYHRMCQKYARSIADESAIYILSAKYGLLRLKDVIEPYELTIGDKGSISAAIVGRQAKEFGILTEECIAIGGERYTQICRQIWMKCKTPLQTYVRGGNGKQMQWMKTEIDKKV